MENAEDNRVRVIDPKVLEEFRRAASPRHPWKEFRDRSLRYGLGLLLLAIPLGAAASYYIWDNSSDELSNEEIIRLIQEKQQASSLPPDSPDDFSAGATAGEESALFVDSSPAGAEVLLDGSPIGTTPIDGHTVESGVYLLSIELERYGTIDTVLFVWQGDPSLQLDFDLAETVSPPRETPDDAPRSRPGAGDETAQRNLAEVERIPAPSTGATEPQARDVEDNIPTPELEQPQTAEESAPEPQSGTLTVLVRPWGSIYVDGVLKRENTDVKYDISLPVGPHVIRIYHPVLGEREISVDLAADRPQHVVVDLLAQEQEQDD